MYLDFVFCISIIITYPLENTLLIISAFLPFIYYKIYCISFFFFDDIRNHISTHLSFID